MAPISNLKVDLNNLSLGKVLKMTTHEKKIYKCNNITNNILNFLYKHNKSQKSSYKLEQRQPMILLWIHLLLCSLSIWWEYRNKERM